MIASSPLSTLQNRRPQRRLGPMAHFYTDLGIHSRAQRSEVREGDTLGEGDNSCSMHAKFGVFGNTGEESESRIARERRTPLAREGRPVERPNKAYNLVSKSAVICRRSSYRSTHSQRVPGRYFGTRLRCWRVSDLSDDSSAKEGQRVLVGACSNSTHQGVRRPSIPGCSMRRRPSPEPCPLESKLRPPETPSPWPRPFAKVNAHPRRIKARNCSRRHSTLVRPNIYRLPSILPPLISSGLE